MMYRLVPNQNRLVIDKKCKTGAVAGGSTTFHVFMFCFSSSFLRKACLARACKHFFQDYLETRAFHYV